MKIFTKFTTILLSSVLILSSFGTTAFAASMDDYDPDKALQYAIDNWNNLTPREKVKGKADCVVFMRSCLEKGGMPVERSYEYTPNDYVSFLKSKGFKEYAMSASDETNTASGDLILYYCGTCKKYYHMSMIIDPYYMTIVHHNVNGKIGAMGKTFYAFAHSGHAGARYTILHYPNYKDKSDSVTAEFTEDNKIALEWNGVDSAVSYNVYRATAANGTYTKIANVKETSYTYSPAASFSGKKLYFKVKPVNAAGEVGKFSPSASESNVKEYGAPTVTKSKATVVKVKWGQASAGCNGYEISQTTSSKKIETTKVVTKATSTYTTLKAPKKKVRYYRVRAYRTIANASAAEPITVYSDWSSAKSFKLK